MFNKETLFSNWHFMRWFRLGIAVFFAVEAFRLHDAMFALLSSFFLFQAATNTGCCGAEGCAMPTSNNHKNKPDEITFEEIK